ncbi:uncharacterized protein LOC125779234 [Bactrocera dorsalis]|uniref:Regulatory protein zeste n=1 Tax=Bactrocera dorsalis TaxID=27457 RepID=A0ABM3K2W9_BACDO|nr:uncharacterized protein LOC125779234 [Bactrocera dorsalis]
MERTTKRTTTQQFQKLVALMENNPDVARGMGNFGSTKKSRAEQWDLFAAELNAIGPPLRNGREWNKVWLDYKLKLKKKIATNRRETVATGGGPYAQQSLSPLEQSVDELLHLQAAVNPTGLAYGSNEVETAVNNNEIQPEERTTVETQRAMDLASQSSSSRPRMTVEEREVIRMKALEKQAEVQDILSNKIAKMGKKVDEIARM